MHIIYSSMLHIYNLQLLMAPRRKRSGVSKTLHRPTKLVLGRLFLFFLEDLKSECWSWFANKMIILNSCQSSHEEFGIAKPKLDNWFIVDSNESGDDRTSIDKKAILTSIDTFVLS